MNVEEIEVNKLIPYDKNPRINTKAVQHVMRSIKAHGFNQPLVISDEYVVCVGHTRLLAAIELGYEKVPCFKKKMTREQFIAYNLADNKTSEFAIWDRDLLKINLEELNELDDELLLSTAFDESIIKGFLNSEEYEDTTDYSSKNSEIDTSSYGKDLDSQCPKCGFEYKAKK